ncbi:MAG: ABC transporter permease [Candidatus Altiarchaeota archaeon]|nr:ABC transporter permease [Candidatus Altiarchaeota archaeon]
MDKGIFGERIFRTATLATLIFFVLFIISVLFSIFLYTDPGTLVSLVNSRQIQFAIELSLLTATVTTIISVIVSVPAAYAISKTEFPGKSVVDTLLDLPIIVSPMALGAALLIFFSTPLGSAIEEHGIKFVFTVAGIVLAQFTVVSALCIRLMKSTFDSINPRYEDVARTLGCSKTQAFFKVTLPMAKNGLIAATILTWARAIGEFGATVTLAGATKLKTETLPIAVFLTLSNADVGKAMTAILIIIVISMASLLLIRKISGKGCPI